MCHPWNAFIPFWASWYYWCPQLPAAASSQKVCCPLCVYNIFLKVGLCICLKLPSSLLYGSLRFSSAGFEQQFCFHVHAFVNLKYTLSQVSSLQIDTSQSFTLSLQGSWLIPRLFLLPFSLCSFTNSFAILLEKGKPKTSQPSSCGYTRVLCGGKMTPSAWFSCLSWHTQYCLVFFLTITAPCSSGFRKPPGWVWGIFPELQTPVPSSASSRDGVDEDFLLMKYSLSFIYT